MQPLSSVLDPNPVPSFRQIPEKQLLKAVTLTGYVRFSRPFSSAAMIAMINPRGLGHHTRVVNSCGLAAGCLFGLD
jgi:hypothetical protein